MKKRTSIQDALPLRKNLSARKKQSGSAKKRILIILLILLAAAMLLLPVIMWLSHVLQEKTHPMVHPVSYEQIRDFTDSDPIPDFISGRAAGFDNSSDGDSEAASTEMVPDSSKMALDGSSEADTNSLKEGNPE